MNQQIKGSIYIFLSALCYATYGVSIRFIGERFQVFTQNSIRSLIIVGIVSLVLIFNKRSWHKFEIKKIWWFLTWLLVGFIITILLFFSYYNLPIGTAAFLFYSTMIIGGYLTGALLYKEKISKIKIISLLFSFIGLVLIFYSEIKFGKTIYILFALLSGLLLGFWNCLPKKISGEYSQFQLVFFNSLFSLILSIPIAVFIGEKIPNIEMNISWIGIFTYAVSQILAMTFIIKGFTYLEVQKATVIMPVEVVFGTIFGLIFFKEIPSFAAIIGGFLIFSAAILPNLAFIKNPHLKTPPTRISKINY